MIQDGKHGQYEIRARTRKSIDDYVAHRDVPNSFVRAVLENNLMLAIMSSDPENLSSLTEIARYVHWEIPSNCHGKVEAVEAWLAKGVEHRKAKEQSFSCGEKVMYFAPHIEFGDSILGELGFVKTKMSEQTYSVVFIKSFPEAAPFNLGEQTGAVCDISRLKIVRESVYGENCPTCGLPAIGAEKRPDGNLLCVNGHKWKRGVSARG